MPELNEGATVQEIREAYEAEKTQCVMRCFGPAQEAMGQKLLPLSPETRKNMNQKSLANVAYAEAENYARGLRDEIKAKYLELDAEMKVAINARAQIIEQELLAPKQFNPTDLIAAAQMSEDALLSAVEIADDLGDAGEDSLLLLFKVARESDVDSVIGRVMTLREDIAELMTELAEAEAVPELNPDDAFETYAQEAPSGRAILGAEPNAVQVASRL